ncbi:MAG TPA: transketolase C-terminal domain-containing protein [Burkholderiales bacterium]|nr:transketolase C-terminal domain-containing protein [Burkholderiales bacterium]
MKLIYVGSADLERVRTLPTGAAERTAIFAEACRLNTLSMIMEAGSGHIGSSFSAMDVVAWLHLNELDPRSSSKDGPRDLYFSSKGHDAPGLYAVLIGLGALDWELLRKLRRLGGLPGHPDVGTPHSVCNTGSLGMGISKAKGMVQAARLAGRPRRMFVMTGDGELQEGQLWESLQGAATHRMHEITVFVDHNKMQSDTWVEKVSSLGNLEAKFAAFGWEVRRCDGHDHAALGKLLSELNQVTDRPKIVIADTVKGKGVRAMENTALGEEELYRFHSGAPAAEIYEKAASELRERVDAMLRSAGHAPLQPVVVEAASRPTPRGERLVSAYSRALVDQGTRRPDLVVLDADLMLDCGLIPFRDKFGSRFIECGIAEQDMVSQAGALALHGFLPVVHSFACFLSTRPNEQIYNNATELSKVIYVGSLAGLLPAGPGHSHQSVRDVSALAAVPGLTLLEPCNEAETVLAFAYCVNEAKSSCYLRLVSIPCDIPYSLPADYRLRRGEGVTLRPGKDALVIGYGPVLLAEVYRAAEQLAESPGIEVEVVNLPWLNEVDTAWLSRLCARHRHMFTLDNHYLAGGQGEMLAARLGGLAAGAAPVLTRLGVESVPACGQNAEVLAAHALDARSIARRIARTLQLR